MSDKWTPTTEQVRAGYATDPEAEYRDPINSPTWQRENERAFDRWLERVKAEAWEEGVQAAKVSDHAARVGYDMAGGAVRTADRRPCEPVHQGEPVKKIIENLSDAKPGDWIEGEYVYRGASYPFEGEAWESESLELMVGGIVVRWTNGTPNSNISIKRITRNVEPLPTEPGVVFYATVRGVENVQVIVDRSCVIERCFYSPRPIHGAQFHATENIDPYTVRIVYTPGQEAGQ